MSQFKLNANHDNESVITNIGKTIRSLDKTKTWAVDIKPYRKKRSIEQNNFYFGPFLGCIVDWLYESRGVTADVEGLHEELKPIYCPKRIVFGANGKVEKIKSTTDLTTKEFNDMLEKISADMADRGLVMPLPDPDWKKTSAR